MPPPRPRVPYSPEQDVLPQVSTPGDYIGTRATPESFGEPVAQGLQRLGGAEEKTGDVLAQAAIERQGMLNETMATNAETTYMSQLGEITGRFRATEGLATQAALGQTKADISALRQSVAATLPNPMAQRAFNMLAQRHEGYALNDTESYAAQQVKVADTNSARASITAAVGTAGDLNVAGDDTRFGHVLQDIDFNTVRMMRNQGYEPGMHQDPQTGEVSFTDDKAGQEARSVWQEQHDHAYAAAWEARLHVLADHNPMEAWKTFSDNRNSIPGEAQVRLDAFFYPKVRGAQLTRGADDYMKSLRDNYAKGGYGGYGTPSNPTLHEGGAASEKPFSNVSAADALPIIEKNESGGQNIYNYRHGEKPTYFTAGGYYQITDTTWRDGAEKAGVDLAQYPTAISAPKDVQTKVATALYNQYGAQPWIGNPKTVADLSSVGKSPQATPASVGGVPGPRYTPPDELLPQRQPLYQSEADNYRSNYAQIMEGAEKEGERLAPDDPVFQQAFVSKVRTRIDSAITAQRLQYEGDGQLINQALNKAIAAGQTPQTIEQLGANDPTLKAAIERFSYMNPIGYEHMNSRVLGQAAREDPDSKKYGPDFMKIRDMVFPRDGSQAKITDPMALNQFVGHGLLMEGYKELQGEMNYKKEDPLAQQAFNNSAKWLHDQVSHQDETGVVKIKDPVGEELWVNYVFPQFKAAFQKGLADGKTADQLLTDGTKDFITNNIRDTALQLRTEAEQAAARVNAPTVTPTATPTVNAGEAMGATGELATTPVAPSKYPQGITEESPPEDIVKWYYANPTRANYVRALNLINEKDPKFLPDAAKRAANPAPTAQ